MAFTKSVVGVAVLVALALMAGVAHAGDGTNEKHSQRGSCGNLVKQKPPKSPPSPHAYDCDLVESLYEFSANLSASDQVVFDEWLQEIQMKLVVNASSMTPDQIVVFVAFELKAFLSVNIEISEKISFLQITDSSCGCKWGFVQDFLSVAVMIQSESVSAIIEVDASGECTLFKSMRDACKNPQEQQWVEELIVKLKLVLNVSGYSEEQKLSFCFEIISEFIVENPSCEDFLMSIDISGFGSFLSFLSVCKVEEQTVNVKEVISGSGSSCPVITALNESVYDNSNNMSSGCRSIIYQLVGKLQVNFESNSDALVRLEFCSANFYSMLTQAPWCSEALYTIKLGVWGTIYDLEFCSNFCHEYDVCDCVNAGPGTSEPSVAPTGITTTAASTTAAPTTAASTTAAPTTAASTTAASTTAASTTAASTTAASTTPSGPNCATRTQLVTMGTGASGACSGNCSALTDALNDLYNSWPVYKRSAFAGTLASIKQIVFGTDTLVVKVSKCVTQLKGCSQTVYAEVMAKIVVVVSVSWGSISSFCTCG